MDNRIFLSPPHMSGKEMKYIKEAFDSNWIAPLGTNVDGFEQELCSYTGIKYGLALSSGTSGIHLALKYFGVGPGDYVFCSSLTFSGSCNPILYQYANPVFIDSEPGSWNMSPEALENAFALANKENKMPKAVIIVDLYGQSADYDRLLPICRHYNVPVIEDAAEALGASYNGQMCGSFGHLGLFSFNGNKIITTSGGGMVLSDNEDIIRKMRFWSTQAREPVRHYEHKEVGYNYRMSNICAGIGRGQLEVLNERIAAKKQINRLYREGLKDYPIKFMPVMDKGDPNYWITVIVINNDCSVTPEDIIIALENKKIESRPVWKPMHMQPVFKDYAYFAHPGSNGISRELFEHGICLPSGSAMTENEQSGIIELIRDLF